MPMLKAAIYTMRRDGLNGIWELCVQRLYRLKLFFQYLSGSSFVNSRYGVAIRMNYRDATFQHYFTGKYGKYYWDKIGKIDKDFVFVDIGANQGLYSIRAAKNPKNLACYSFEPIPKTFSLLSQNIEANEVTEKCQLIMKAISKKNAETTIKISNFSSGAASLSDANMFESSNLQTTKIETIDGHSLWKIIEHDDLPIYVKIDVEGHEVTVIEQLMQDPKSELIQEIFYEVDERWVDPMQIQGLLYAKNFKNFKKHGFGGHYDVLASRSS